jgi:hypothetical protein
MKICGDVREDVGYNKNGKRFWKKTINILVAMKIGRRFWRCWISWKY